MHGLHEISENSMSNSGDPNSRAGYSRQKKEKNNKIIIFRDLRNFAILNYVVV